jgi:anti-anti-sigma factor
MLAFSTHLTEQGILIVTLSGELDQHTHQDVFDCVEDEINKGYRNLVLDCEDLRYVSSIGIGTLVRIHARMKKIGGDVRIANLRGAVADMFVLTRVGRIFAMYDLLDDACASFRI